MKSYPFGTLFWVNRDENVAEQNFPTHRKMYFSQLLKANSLCETMYSQTQKVFTFVRIQQSRIKCEICSKLTIEATDVVLVTSLLTFDVVDTFLVLFC